MKRAHAFGFGLFFFMLGTLVSLSGQKGTRAFNAAIFTDKDAKVAATALLEQALTLAEDGSWERIAVGRAWYLGGDKVKGQEIFDRVTSTKKVESSDWFRIARVYAEAGEWDKAEPAFDRALSMNVGDDSGMIEYGALANINKNRSKAEVLFTKALTKESKEFWHWVGAGGSYLGVPPQ